MDVSSYVTQHRDALAVVQKIQDAMKSAAPNAQEISKYLVDLTGKLKFHLSMEDKFVYPKATASQNSELQATAKKMQTEMTGIADAFAEYAKKWNSNTIGSDFPKFAAETNKIIAILGKRIDAEEKSFYPLVHKHL